MCLFRRLEKRLCIEAFISQDPRHTELKSNMICFLLDRRFPRGISFKPAVKANIVFDTYGQYSHTSAMTLISGLTST